MPIDKFDTDNYRKEQYDLLEYLVAVADRVAPDIAKDTEGNMYTTDSQAPHIFMRRYNSNRLNTRFSYPDYISRDRLHNENIIDIIEGLGIDAERFWYLILFISDYVTGSTTDTLRVTESPKEQIDKFVEFVENNCSDFNAIEGFMSDKPMTLSLRVKGRRLEIDNPNTIAMIASACRELLPMVDQSSILNNVKLEMGYNKSNSVKIWLFARLFRYFFERYPQFAGKKRDSDGVSKSTLLLISKLAYFVGFTDNEDYDVSDENLKAILKQYRNLKLDTMNTIYG
ncbi:MAG: hypothetical protein HDS01_04805 [Bacteroides sp.]|nr:hypothetical protein [Bacteroides sp.]